jgi:hypothetical protein
MKLVNLSNENSVIEDNKQAWGMIITKESAELKNVELQPEK